MKSRESAGGQQRLSATFNAPPVRADGGRYRNLLWQNGNLA